MVAFLVVALVASLAAASEAWDLSPSPVLPYLVVGQEEDLEASQEASLEVALVASP